MNQYQKKISVLFFYLLTWNSALYAQPKYLDELDSLKIQLKSEKESAKKVQLNLEIASFMHTRYNEDSTFHYNKKARELFSIVQDSTPFLLFLHSTYIRGYAFRGDYKKALRSIIDIEPVLLTEFARKIEDKEKKEQHSIELIRAHNTIGDVYRKIGDFEKSYRYFIKGIQVAEEIKSKFYLSVGYNNLGLLYYEEEINDKSKFYYKKALQLSLEKIGKLNRQEDLSEKYNLGIIYNNLGNVHSNLDEYDSAKSAFTKSMSIMIELEVKYAEGVLLHNLAKLYFKEENFDDAMAHEQQALAIQYSLDSKDQLAIILKSISQIFIERKNWKEAEKNALEAYEIAYPNEQHKNVREIASLLVNIYDSIGDVSNAYRFIRIFNEKNDLLSNEAKEKAIENLKIGYETERSEAENQLLKQKQKVDQSLIEKQKLWVISLIGGGSLLFILLFISYRFYLERKKAAKQLSMDKETITKQTDKLQALDAFKSRFFANVSHDLRTPLTLIQGHIFQVKEDENFLTQKSQNSIQKLENNTRKLIQLTDEIRDLILLEDDKLNLNYEKIEIVHYLKRIIEFFSSAAALKKIKLVLKSSIDQQLMIHLDPLQFEKIIYNLVSNALKFTPSGGCILVKLDQSKDHITIAVEDNGTGISENKAAHVFNRYYQADKSVKHNKEGLGIGLALVLELVELHGGKIHVESKLGEGSRFIMQLPFNLDKSLTEKHIESSYISQNKDLILADNINGENSAFVDVNEKDKRSKGDKVVLVVDDHPDIRNYIKDLIEVDYVIRQASNGKDALGVLNKEKIDIVITDIMMPLMDGHALIQEIKKQENLKHIPVLVISARTTEEDKLKVLEKGVNDFLAKPFKPNELKLRINNALIKHNSEGSIWEVLANNNNKLSDIEKNVLAKVNSLILSKIDDSSLSVQHIADELISSSRNAYSIINRLTDMNPKDYIKHIRFQYARDLMTKKKVKSVTEAAHAIGMSNPTRFSDQFQKKVGIHPAELLG